MTRLLDWLMGLAEAPSRVRLLESELAHLRRHVGVLMRAKEAEDAAAMERRVQRGLDESRAVMAGRTTTRLTGSDSDHGVTHAATCASSPTTAAQGAEPAGGEQ